MMEYNKNLKQYNTFGIDVTAQKYVEFSSVEELQNIFDNIGDDKWYILGGGSNTLFTKDYQGLIIHPVAKGIEILSEDDISVTIRGYAGVEWDYFVDYLVRNGYYGAENLSHIPGSVGAAPVQNIGAYGSEVKDIICSVTYYDTIRCEVVTMTALECAFGYRDSIFKREMSSSIVVLYVDFILSKIFVPNLEYGNILSELDSSIELTAQIVRDTVIRIREKKLPNPDIIGNGGSFFKNPIISLEKFNDIKAEYPSIPSYSDVGGVKIPAGWLIDISGWKGYYEKSVGVHKEQALVLVNYGGGSGADVLALADKIIEDVEMKFDIRLLPEINIV